MSNEKFKLEGFRELEKALLELETATAKRISNLALRKASEPILEAYKAKTTVRSGALVENETIGKRLNPRQKRMTPRPGPSEAVVHIGTADPAGIQEEFGGRQAANPSLTPAWDSEGGRTALERLKKLLWASIGRAAAKAARIRGR